MRIPLHAAFALLLATVTACSAAPDGDTPAMDPSAPAAAQAGPETSSPAAASPTPSPSPAPTPRATSDDTDLRDRLVTTMGDPRFATVGPVGVSVLDEEGRIVFEHRAEVPMLPASTQKLVTAAAALRTLGADHRYRTTVRATADIGEDGTLVGDLVLVGSGDPALATPQYGAEAYPQRPRTPLESLADQLVADGLRRVTGSVVGDPSVFPEEPLAPGWPDRYVTDRETRFSSGLTVNAGLHLFLKDGRVVSDVVANPPAETARELYRLLEERGVAIDYAAIATRTPPPTVVELASVHSPPMLELLRHTLQRSDNHMADAIFLTIGLEEAGTGSWTAARRAVHRTLEDLTHEAEGVVFADGSGLSRDDRVSAAFLASLDLEMTRTEDRWQELMAVSGESGTLRRRLRGTVAAGRLRGKTGTLDDVRSLAGTVFGPEGGRYHLAVIVNDLAGPARWPARELTDEIVLTLVEDLHGCIRLPVPAETPAPTPSPYRLECAD